MWSSLRTGWTQRSTDFPNYYTAAVLARHGEPLHKYYNWTWFEKQLSLAGFEAQLGAYTPQTPLAMLPMVALAGYKPLVARRLWLLVNLILLGVVIGLLSRFTEFRWEWISMLVVLGKGSLATNILYGQYYVFLLFLITITFCLLDRRRDMASGLLAGITTGLKLYTAPLLVYFAVERKWRAVAGMTLAIGFMAALAITLFGWGDVWHYASRVLPRTLEGGSIDPYNPGNPTLATFLGHTFVSEPQLNPTPIFDAPWMCFLLLPAVRLGLMACTTLGIGFTKTDDLDQDFAWAVIALLLLSTSVASYTFILLLLPVVLLLKTAGLRKRVFLIVSYTLLNAHLQANWLFPKVLLLVILFVVIGWDRLKSVPPIWSCSAVAVILVFSAVDAKMRMMDYAAEPGRRYPQIAIEHEGLLASYPVISQFGLFYQCMESDRYALCWLRDGKIDHIRLDGQILHPSATTASSSISFELVAPHKSTMMEFDPAIRAVRLSGQIAPPEPAADVRSPDGKWIARISGIEGSRQLWLDNVATKETMRMAGGRCDNAYPAWELDSSAIVFASDCGRAYGLHALYRAPIPSR